MVRAKKENFEGEPWQGSLGLVCIAHLEEWLGYTVGTWLQRLTEQRTDADPNPNRESCACWLGLISMANRIILLSVS